MGFRLGCDLDYGTCTGPNTCTCQSGHWDADCAQRCTCVNGRCSDGEPNVCLMQTYCIHVYVQFGDFRGWDLCSVRRTFLRCLISRTVILVHMHAGPSGTGLCSECLSTYAGANCDLSVPAVIVPSLLVVAVLATAVVFFSSWYIKR